MPVENDYYLTIITNYREIGAAENSKIRQPTPEGLAILAEHYRDKYEIDLRVVDQQDNGPFNTLKSRFEDFKTKCDVNTLGEDKPTGIILSQGQSHAIPVLLSKEQDEKFMLIFDSTALSSPKGYYGLANLFPEHQVLVNNGQRQADNQSCITDSVVILKDALRLDNIGSYVLENKIVSTPPKLSKFTSDPLKYDNFAFFNMPEELLKTAQSSKFVSDSNPDLNKPVNDKNKTIEDYRQRYRKPVVVDGKQRFLNTYLQQKSGKCAETILKKLEQQDVILEPSSPIGGEGLHVNSLMLSRDNSAEVDGRENIT